MGGRRDLDGRAERSRWAGGRAGGRRDLDGRAERSRRAGGEI